MAAVSNTTKTGRPATTPDVRVPASGRPGGRGAPAPSERGTATAAAAADPYAAYTDLAKDYDVDTPDLEWVLPPFVAGLLAVAGRQLASLAYRDVFVLGDKPLNRRSLKAKATVFADLPLECDRQAWTWRLAWARCLDDLAADLEVGRAPLPRCTGERWALRVMADRAPYLLACSDAELADLGVAVPADRDYRPPYWDGVVDAFVVEDAAYSIPEACAGDGDGNDAPPGRWEIPAYWFSPYRITTSRTVEHGHLPWVQARLTGTPADPPGGFDRAATLLGYHIRVDPWAAYTDEFRDSVDYRVLAEVLTPQTASLLIVAAGRLAEVGYQEIVGQGDEALERDVDDDGGWYTTGVFLANLPPICDGQNQAWRLAMVRAVDDLAGDLRDGRAPLPRCNAEEIALHLILSEASALLDEADDRMYFAQLGLPPRPAWSPRHCQFDVMREVFFQDEDVLMAYDAGIADVATDPEHAVNQLLRTGDLRPPAWFCTFHNLRPRTAARGFPASVLAALRASSPALRFTPATYADDRAVALAPVPIRLDESFELLVGLAQRRFFDRPCAIAMARTLHDLLVAFLDTPDLHPAQVWILGGNATAGNELLIVDEQFSITGHTNRWRFTADLTDGDARRWVRTMLTDCAAKVVATYATRSPLLFLDTADAPTPSLDPALPQALSARAAHLAARTTLAGFLTHRRSELGLNVAQVADAALLPPPVITGWEDGSDATPTQLLRCAPVLQLPEDVLLHISNGLRDPRYWPLPSPTTRIGPLNA
jgi:hypothetical protein